MCRLWAWNLVIAILWLRFGHKRGKKEKSSGGNRGQSKKTCSVSENLHDKPSENIAPPCAQAGRQGNQTLGKVKAPGTPHQVCGNNNRNNTEYSGRHAIQKLDGDDAPRT